MAKGHVGPKAKGGGKVSGRKLYTPNPNVSGSVKSGGPKHSKKHGHR